MEEYVSYMTKCAETMSPEEQQKLTEHFEATHLDRPDPQISFLNDPVSGFMDSKIQILKLF
jgi:hypothetical protein